MQSLNTGIQRYLKALDPGAAKAVRAARNNRRFAAAVERVWDDNPLAGDFVLAHVNSLYFAKEEIVCKGPRNAWKRVLGVYLDDPAARAELNARRETLALSLLQDGFDFDEVRIIPSRLGMRERRAFPDALARVTRVLSGEDPSPDKPKQSPKATSETDGIASSFKRMQDEIRLLQTFKRSVCLALGDIDHAQAFLARIEGACLKERYIDGTRREKRSLYACQLFTSAPEPVRGIVDTFAPSITAHAKELGLRLVGIDVLESPIEIKGQRAFPSSGAPRSYHQPIAQG